MHKFKKYLRLEFGIIAVLLLGSVFGPDFINVKVGPIPITLDRIAWGGLILCFLIPYLGGRLPVIKTGWADLAFLGFLGYLAVNIATSDWKYKGLQPVAQWLFFYIVPAGLYFIARYLPDRESFAKIFTFAMIGLGVYLSVTALLEVAGIHALIFPRFIINSPMQEFLGRGRGPFLNPIANGIVLTICLASSLVWWNQFDHKQRIGILGFSALMLIGIFCTLTRSVWLSAGIVSLGFLWFFSPKKLKAGLMMTVPVAGFLFFTVGKDKINSFKRDKNVSQADMAESIQLRPLLAVIAGRMIEDKPFFGHGFRQYQQTKRIYHFRDNSNLPVQKVLPFVQHNVFLAYGVDLGLVGLALYLSLLAFWSWKATWLLIDKNSPGHAKQAAAILLCIIICIVINGMFHDVACIPMLNHYVFCLAGWTVGLYQYQMTKQQSIEPAVEKTVAKKSATDRSSPISLSAKNPLELTLKENPIQESFGQPLMKTEKNQPVQTFDSVEPVADCEQKVNENESASESRSNTVKSDQIQYNTRMESNIHKENSRMPNSELSFGKLIEDAFGVPGANLSNENEQDSTPQESESRIPARPKPASPELKSVFRLEQVLEELKAEDDGEVTQTTSQENERRKLPTIRAKVSEITSPNSDGEESDAKPENQEDERPQESSNPEILGLDQFVWPKSGHLSTSKDRFQW